jgi:hypothetical protein
MTDHLEDLILAEARRQGYRPNAEAMRQAAIDLAGSTLNGQNLITMPGRGSISPADFVRSLRSLMPSAFSKVGEKPSDDKPAGKTLTEFMREQIEGSRKQIPLPDDFDRVRNRYAVGSLTRTMMDSIAAARRQGKRQQ